MDKETKEYLDGLVNWEQLNILMAEKKKVIKEISQLRCKLMEVIDENERNDINRQIDIHRETLLYIESIRKKLIDILHS